MNNDKIVSANKDGITVRMNGVSSFYRYDLIQIKQQLIRKKEVNNTCEKLVLNAIQREMYRRLMYGLNNYTNEEKSMMSSKQISKIVKDHDRAKRYLHIMKAKKYYEADNNLLNAIFTHCPTGTKDSDWFLYIPKTVTLNKLGISPKEIVDEFINRKLLPENFYDLKPVL